MFEGIEEIFASIRALGDYPKALVTLATATGTLFLTLYALKLTFHTITGLRLYVFSQFCCKVNYVKRYGKWAVISGSTDGIGLAMAKELARRGHSIVVIGRNEEKLANTKLSLEEEQNVGEVLTVKIDLSDSSPENYERIRSQIDPDNRDIGILINNAGLFPEKFRRFNHFEMDYLRTIVNVNVLAAVYLTKMIMPSMLERSRGLVVNVSSGLGALTGSYLSLYAPTKAFMDSFSRQLQAEYSSHPVDIINLTPGPVQTRILEASSSFSKAGLLNPSPEDFSRTSINALATRIHFISGTIVHGILNKFGICFESMGLTHFIIKMNHVISAKDFAASPVIKRKNRVPLSSQGVDGSHSAGG